MGWIRRGGRVVKGWIDEVAVFDKALTTAQLTSMNAAALVPPQITVQPQAPVGDVYEGMDVTLTVGAAGQAPLSYQWRKDEGNLGGRTSASLALTNLKTTDSGAYDVVVTNPNGTVTSATVTSNVRAGPPAFYRVRVN